jgi:hypothetical protein
MTINDVIFFQWCAAAYAKDALFDRVSGNRSAANWNAEKAASYAASARLGMGME